jgi:hypothetical protein
MLLQDIHRFIQQQLPVLSDLNLNISRVLIKPIISSNNNHKIKVSFVLLTVFDSH